MPRNLYVANLSHVVGTEELQRIFAAHGTVRWARIADRLKTGSATAEGFVQMESDEQGEIAIKALNGFSHRGLPLVVRWAQPGRDVGLNLSRMFESMNVPLEGEGQRLQGPTRDDRGECGGSEDDLGKPTSLFNDGIIDSASRLSSDIQSLGAHRKAYDALFQHPISRNLQWPDVRSMLIAFADVTERRGGVMKFSRNGHTLVVRRPPGNDFSDVRALMQIRHFLESSEFPPAGDLAEGIHLLVVLDHREARIFRTELRGSVPRRITLYDPHLTRRHLLHVNNVSCGPRKPELQAYYDAIVSTLAGAQSIVIFASSTAPGGAIDQLVAEVEEHHPDLARRIAGALVVDGRHMGVDELLVKARAFYTARGSRGSISPN